MVKDFFQWSYTYSKLNSICISPSTKKCYKVENCYKVETLSTFTRVSDSRRTFKIFFCAFLGNESFKRATYM